MKTRSRPARVALLFAALSLLGPCGAALADGDGEGGEGAEGVQQKVKAQVEKILKLMRENEKALLEASRGSGRKPEGITSPPAEMKRPGSSSRVSPRCASQSRHAAARQSKNDRWPTLSPLPTVCPAGWPSRCTASAWTSSRSGRTGRVNCRDTDSPGARV